MTIVQQRQRVLVRTALGLAVLLSALTAASTSTAAADGADEVLLSVQPLDMEKFDLTAKPGGRIELAAVIANDGEEAIDALTYVGDVYTLHNGGLGVRNHDEPSSGVASWVDYPTETLTLEPDKPIQRMFTVIVPDNVAPGEYFARLIIQNAEPVGGDPDEGGFQLRQIIRRTTSIRIEVPGDWSSAITIGGGAHVLFAEQSAITFDVANTGTTRLDPHGNLTVWDADGAPALERPVTLDTFFPNTASISEIVLDEPLPSGSYTAELTLVDDATGASASSGIVTIDVPVIEAAPVSEQPAAEGVSPQPAQSPVLASSTGGISVTTLLLIGIGGAVGGAAVVLLASRLRRQGSGPQDDGGASEPSQVDSSSTVLPSGIMASTDAVAQTAGRTSVMRVERPAPRPYVRTESTHD